MGKLTTFFRDVNHGSNNDLVIKLSTHDIYCYVDIRESNQPFVKFFFLSVRDILLLVRSCCLVVVLVVVVLLGCRRYPFSH